MPPRAPPRCAVLLARISDVDWSRDEHGRKVLDTSGGEGQIEDLSAYAAEIRWGVGPRSGHPVVENDTSAYRMAIVTMPDGRQQRRPKRPKFWRLFLR